MEFALVLESWPNDKIEQMIVNYRERAVRTGGLYTLAELLVEQRRRTKSEIDTVALAQAIITKAAAAPDGLATYKELWMQFRPGEPWIGNASQQMMGNALSRVVGDCVQHGLPILTVLVVQTGSRALDPKAIANIANDARDLGVDVDPEPDKFIERQRELARAVAIEALPNDDAGA